MPPLTLATRIVKKQKQSGDGCRQSQRQKRIQKKPQAAAQNTKTTRQVYQVDYIETHAPVTVLTSFRICLAEAARYELGVSFFDISGAYLEAPLTERVLLVPFPGVTPPEEGGRP